MNKLLLIATFAVLAAGLLGFPAVVTADEVTVNHRGIDAVPIERKPPRYPRDAANAWTEGWVLVSFAIDLDGRPMDVEILDSSIKGFFDRSSLSAVKKWTYRPAMLNGRPVVQTKTRVLLTYVFEDSEGSVSREFSVSYKRAIRAIQKKEFEKAKSAIDRLEKRKRPVLAEVGYLDMLKGLYWKEMGDEKRALRHFERSLIIANHFPEAKTYKSLLQQLYYLSVRQIISRILSITTINLQHLMEAFNRTIRSRSLHSKFKHTLMEKNHFRLMARFTCHVQHAMKHATSGDIISIVRDSP